MRSQKKSLPTQQEFSPTPAHESELPQSPLPNSALLNMAGMNESSLSDDVMQNKLRSRFLANQRPDAETEADAIASHVRAHTPEEMKQSLGEEMQADFSDVSFHTDAAAAAKADAIGAEAYTEGNDVYFGSGGYSPETAAHELVHTVQQGVVESPVATAYAPEGGVQMKSIFSRIHDFFFGGNEEQDEAEADLVPEDAKKDADDAAERLLSAEPNPLKGKEVLLDDEESASSTIKSALDESSSDGELTHKLGDASSSSSRLESDEGSSSSRDAQDEALVKPSLTRSAQFGILRGQLGSSKKGGWGFNSSEYRGVMRALEGVRDATSGGFTANPAQDLAAAANAEMRYAQLIKACQAYLGRKNIGSTKNGALRIGMVQQALALAQQDLPGIQNARIQVTKGTPEGRSAMSWDDVINSGRAVKFDTSEMADSHVAGGSMSDVKKLARGGKNYYFKGLERTRSYLPEMGYTEIPGMTETDKNTSAAMTYSHLDFGDNDSAEITRRNVATSVMANLLGVDDKVAGSQLAELHDADSGETRQGIVMDEAKGSSMGALMRQDKPIRFAPTLQRDLATLQLFDTICGQSDRHAGNVMYQQDEEGNVVGAEAFDNDAAFGLVTDLEASYDSQLPPDLSGLGLKAPAEKRSVSGEGLALPYLDRAFAQRVKALDPALVRLGVKGLITEAETDALVTRLTKIQAAITHDESEHPEKFIGDDDWGEETHSAFASHVKDKSDKGDFNGTYYHSFLGDLRASYASKKKRKEDED